MGKVFVVGIGPGNFENMTIRADRALCACDAIVGYPVYVDLVKDRYPGKALYQTPMTKEVARCQLALDLAREGKTVCLVCSGDSGIYGMAALVFELRACAAARGAEGKRVFRQTHAGAVRACRTDGRFGKGPDGRAYCARKRTQRYYDDQIKESLTWQKADTAAACPWVA